MKNHKLQQLSLAFLSLLLVFSLFACTASPITPSEPPVSPESGEGDTNTPGGDQTPSEPSTPSEPNVPDGDQAPSVPDNPSEPDTPADPPEQPPVSTDSSREEDENPRHVLTLPTALDEGSYTLYYENETGVIPGYSAICTLTKDSENRAPSYRGFIPENCAPIGATVIGIYGADGTRVSSLPLGSLKVNLGEKLYSFGALSDIHTQSNTAKDDLARALLYLNNVAHVNFITVAGDLTQWGTREDLAEYKTLVDTYSPTTRVFEVAGNHEGQQRDLVEYVTDYTGEPLYYAYYHQDDVFLMLGLSAASLTLFKQDALQWLYESLEKNKDKRCFVFQHVPSQTTSGAALGVCDYDIWDGADAAVFESLVKHYPNVTWFHGHSHFKLDLQNLDPKANYDGSEGFHSVHIPSLAVPEAPNVTGSVTKYTDASEGYVVDVYENGILLYGRDFANEEFLPVATYYLDTTGKTVEADTYYDPTGTVMSKNTNLLKPNDTWFEGCSVDKSAITFIAFAPSYAATYYDEKWAADVCGTGAVTIYRNSTTLVIVGNEYGILANPDSSRMFAHFSSLTYVSGFEYLNTSIISSLDSLFDGCTSLRDVDLSALSLSHVYNLRMFFRGCTGLTRVSLPDGIGSAIAAGQTLYVTAFFEGCTSLKTADLSVFALPEGSAIYFSSVFMQCSALIDVTLPTLSITNFVNAFYGCSALKTLNISTLNFSRCNDLLQAFAGCRSLQTLTLPDAPDFSRVTRARALFSGCTALTLDCSGWVLPVCTDYTDFNKNAPGVTPPASARK